jgi:hypothetical protein
MYTASRSSKKQAGQACTAMLLCASVCRCSEGGGTQACILAACGQQQLPMRFVRAGSVSLSVCDESVPHLAVQCRLWQAADMQACNTTTHIATTLISRHVHAFGVTWCLVKVLRCCDQGGPRYSSLLQG